MMTLHEHADALALALRLACALIKAETTREQLPTYLVDPLKQYERSRSDFPFYPTAKELNAYFHTWVNQGDNSSGYVLGKFALAVLDRYARTTPSE